MAPNVQRVSVWVSVFFGVLMLVAFVSFPGFFPPMSPRLSADQLATFYRHHQAMIRFSMILFNLCGLGLMPFFMVIVYQMKRMGTPTQVLAYGYLSAVVSGATLFAIADLFWLIAAFRPERDPQLTLLLNDFAWIVFTAPVGMIVAQNLCLALAVHLDARPDPVLPRWVAPFAVLTGLAMLPAACAAAVTTGPLAWNGAISFWLRIAAYSLFVMVMFSVLRGAIAREEAEESRRAPGCDDVGRSVVAAG